MLTLLVLPAAALAAANPGFQGPGPENSLPRTPLQVDTLKAFDSRQVHDGVAALNVVHLAPFTTEEAALAVSLNGIEILTDFAYGGSTGYFYLAPGSYTAAVTPNDPTYPAAKKTLALAEGARYSLIISGGGANRNLGLLLLVDDNSEPEPENFRLRIVHLAPFLPGKATMGVHLSQYGLPIFDDLVNYGSVAATLELPAGQYDLTFTTADGQTPLIAPRAITFAAGDLASVYATGDGAGEEANQELGAFALPNGGSGIFLPLKLPPRSHLALVLAETRAPVAP